MRPAHVNRKKRCSSPCKCKVGCNKNNTRPIWEFGWSVIFTWICTNRLLTFSIANKLCEWKTVSDEKQVRVFVETPDEGYTRGIKDVSDEKKSLNISVSL